MSPLKAAELAAANHLKIYTIGIGADEMLVGGFFGYRKVNPSADIDEGTLIKIAESTGGYYYRAKSLDELNNIYLRLDELEPVEKEKQYFRPKRELYFIPLAMTLVLAGLLSWKRNFSWMALFVRDLIQRSNAPKVWHEMQQNSH